MPQEIRELFNKYSEGGAHVTPYQLRRFLTEVQGEVVDDERDEVDTQKVVQEVLQKRHHITKFARHNLTLDDFHHYLFSTDFNPPIRSQVMRVLLFQFNALTFSQTPRVLSFNDHNHYSNTYETEIAKVFMQLIFKTLHVCYKMQK